MLQRARQQLPKDNPSTSLRMSPSSWPSRIIGAPSWHRTGWSSYPAVLKRLDSKKG